MSNVCLVLDAHKPSMLVGIAHNKLHTRCSYPNANWSSSRLGVWLFSLKLCIDRELIGEYGMVMVDAWSELPASEITAPAAGYAAAAYASQRNAHMRTRAK